MLYCLVVLFLVSCPFAVAYPTSRHTSIINESIYNNIHPCAQPGGVTGLCLAYIPSYSYSSSTGKCDMFIYGGCQGTANRFPTVYECMSTCGNYTPEFNEVKLILPPFEIENASTEKQAESREESNDQPLIEEPKESSTEQIYQSVEDPNPPEAESDISDACKLSSEMGPCKALLPRFYFNGDRCEQFIYGGCEGNTNNFITIEECKNKCGLTSLSEAV